MYKNKEENAAMIENYEYITSLLLGGGLVSISTPTGQPVFTEK
jgi:hypothetical protein